MGAETRQMREVYRESGVFAVDHRGTRQWISAFFITTGMSVAMLAGAGRFENHPGMKAWLEGVAAAVFVLGSLAVGVRLLNDGWTDIKRLRDPRVDVTRLPAHIRPSRNAAIARLVFGTLLAVIIPGVVAISWLM